VTVFASATLGGVTDRIVFIFVVLTKVAKATSYYLLVSKEGKNMS
jgi:hypothetical protein